MNPRRFYVRPETVELKHDFWLHDVDLRKRMAESVVEGGQAVLFDGVGEDRLYKLSKVEPDGVHLEMITELERTLPKKHIYLFWALISGDKNNEILSNFTELGVSNFVPIITDNSDKTFDIENANKLVITIAEAKGWSSIPHVREPLSVKEMRDEYIDKVKFLPYVGESCGVVIGPANGWTNAESIIIKDLTPDQMTNENLSYRVEAASASVIKLLQ